MDAFPLDAQQLVFKNIVQSLNNVPLHSATAHVERLTALNFPVHLAIHHSQGTNQPNIPQQYVKPHRHIVAEINIFIPESEDFTYQLQLADEITAINGHYSVWIPADTAHSANFIRGQGYFICIILDKTENLSWIPAD